MTRDVVDLLVEAGQAMDDDGADAVAERVASMDQGETVDARAHRHRRRVSAAWLAAAAVLVLSMVWLAGLSIPADDPAPPAGSSEVVALAPSDRYENWLSIEAAHVDGIGLQDSDIVVITPRGEDPRRRAVTLERGERRDPPDPGYRQTEGAGLTGKLVDQDPGHRLQIELPGSSEMLTLTSGDAVAVDELFELAAALDLSLPLIGQDAPNGWQVHTTSVDHGLASMRQLFFSGTDGQHPERLWISTIMGVDERAMWLLDDFTEVSDGEVRGRPAWIGHSGRSTLTWMETDDVMVMLWYSPPIGPGLDLLDDAHLERAIALAEDLVPVDEEDWSALVELAAEHRALAVREN